MAGINFTFEGRVLRHRYVAYDKLRLNCVPLRKSIINKPDEAMRLLFPNLSLKDVLRDVFLACPGISQEGKTVPGHFDAAKLTRQIYSNPSLRNSFSYRNGEEPNEQNLQEANVGRLGGERVSKMREGMKGVAEALKLLLKGDIDGFNAFRKKVDMPFDFTGMNALGSKDLRRVDTFEVKFDDIVSLPSVAKKNSFGFIRINSGFCAGMRIDARLDAPALVHEYFLGELLDKFYPDWLALKENLLYTAEADIAFYPRRPQVWRRAGSQGQFIFENEYLSNLVKIREAVEKVLNAGKMPVILGGDHSIAFATQGTINDYYARVAGKKIGLVWIDAHGDINTEHTTPSGNFHGGPVAGLLGLINNPGFKSSFERTIDFKNLVYIAERDLDEGEIEIIKRNGIRWFTMDEISDKGVDAVMKEAYAIATDGTAGVSVSFDIDAFDAELVPGTGTPVAGGLTIAMGKDVCKAISGWEKLLAFELVEINPANDTNVITRKLGARVLLTSLLGVDAIK